MEKLKQQWIVTRLGGYVRASKIISVYVREAALHNTPGPVYDVCIDLEGSEQLSPHIVESFTDHDAAWEACTALVESITPPQAPAMVADMLAELAPLFALLNPDGGGWNSQKKPS